MLALDYVIPLVVTPAAVNAQINALNTVYGGLTGFTPCPLLDPVQGVVNIWTKALRDLSVLPAIGYEAGFLREGATEIVLQGKNRDEIPVIFTAVAKATDEMTARQQAEVLWEAMRMVIDAVGTGLEGKNLDSVVPIRGITKLGPTVQLEAVTVDITGAGQRLGLRSRWLITLDTVRQ